MPAATHWICCKCGFGPMLIANYPSCLNCQHQGARRECCTHASLALKSAHFPSATASFDDYEMSRPSSPSLPVCDAMDDCIDVLSATQIISSPCPVRSHPTDLYICCSCGDGPKVYQHHVRCVMCNHDACRYCKHVK